jgi:hypothetical protein
MLLSPVLFNFRRKRQFRRIDADDFQFGGTIGAGENLAFDRAFGKGDFGFTLRACSAHDDAPFSGIEHM